jgi:hypothetical protein
LRFFLSLACRRKTRDLRATLFPGEKIIIFSPPSASKIPSVLPPPLPAFLKIEWYDTACVNGTRGEGGKGLTFLRNLQTVHAIESKVYDVLARKIPPICE